MMLRALTMRVFLENLSFLLVLRYSQKLELEKNLVFFDSIANPTNFPIYSTYNCWTCSSNSHCTLMERQLY